MAQTAKGEAEKAIKDTTDKAADLTREATDRAEGAARLGLRLAQRTTDAALEVAPAVTRRAAEGTAEFNQVLAEAMQEQIRRNIELFKALTGTVDWNEVAQLQAAFLRESLERGAQLTERYFGVAQAVLTSAAEAAKEQTRKAA